MRPLGRFILLVCVLGALSVAVAFWVAEQLGPPAGVPTSVSPYTVVLFTALTIAGQVAYIRVRHGTTTEELNFLEAAITAALLCMPGREVLIAGLMGILLAEIMLRRDLLKIAYNVGTWAASASIMLVLYYVLAQGQSRFDWRAVLAMIASALAFAAWNTFALAHLFFVVEGTPRRVTLSAEWRLSALMTVGGVGLGMTAVSLAFSTPALLPFAALPALALWYAYGAAAQHAEARERNRWLVSLGGYLATHGQAHDTLAESGHAIREIVGAPELLIVDPATADPTSTWQSEALASSAREAGPIAIAAHSLPPTWRTGVVTRMDLGGAEPGAILLGSTTQYRHSPFTGRTRGWSLEEADAPVLGALVAAVGSAMRAGAAFDSLTEETAKLTAVVDNTSDGIAMVDDAGSIRLWSRTMARMTGVDGDEVAGTDLADAPEIVRTLLGAAGAATTPAGRAPTPVQVHLTREDGEELDVSIAAVRVREATTSANADSPGWVRILTVHDETRERRVERMKTDFVATISHELRTPITPIKGYAYLLAKHSEKFKDEESRAQALTVIMDSSDHLERLVDDLLMASRGVTHGGRLKIEMGVENLQDVVTQAVATFPQMAHRVRLDLPGEPVAIQCDHVRAVQCLSNLIGNAEKYTPAESPLEIWAEISPMLVEIHVRDHGPGIPASEQAKVFERFYRREDPFTMRTGGAGLGLHIARELAMAMGGALTLTTPADGTGAEFILHLLTDQAPRVSAGASAGMLAPAATADPGGSVAAHADQSGDTGTVSGAEGATMGTESGAAPGNRLTPTRE